MTSQANPLIDCRLCLEKHRHILPITAEISEVYKNVTQIKLARLYSYSNSICLLCYKKLLAASSYREMLIQIESKLLSTFNHTQFKEQTPSSNKAIRSNGAPKTPLLNASTSNTNKPESAQKFARQQFKQYAATIPGDDDDDMSLLEEIVSFDAPNTSQFINEQEHDNEFPILSDDDTKDDFDDEGSSFRIKDEPVDNTEINQSEDQNWSTQMNPDKPFKCTFPGCKNSSSSRTALLKHRRRVHGIRMRQSIGGGKITRSRPSHLYNQLHLSNETFQCRFCNLSLRNRRVLLRHIETVHMQAKFYCTVPGCTHASTRKDNYRLHLKNYHRDLPEEQMERVLAETRDMKPVYANNLIELQLKREQLQSEIDGEDRTTPDIIIPDESIEEENGSEVEKPSTFSIIDISGEYEQNFDQIISN